MRTGRKRRAEGFEKTYSLARKGAPLKKTKKVMAAEAKYFASE
jgi:hypothetical protein